MNWGKSLTTLEYSFAIIFLVLYLLYFIRTTTIAKRLGTTARAIALKFFLRSTYFTLLIIALLSPNFHSSDVESHNTGKDIYIAVDLSTSMNAVDILPTRLEKIKLELFRLVEQLKDNRIGIILFSTDAFIRTPLTFDSNVLKAITQKLDTKMLAEGGTDLNASLSLLDEKLFGEEKTRTRTKVAILITDGESQVPIEKTRFKQHNIPLMVLGVGTEEGGKIKIGNAFKKDKTAKVIISRLKKNQLTELAQSTGGDYFELSNKENEINKLIEEIKLVENSYIDSRKMMVSNNNYIYFLLLAWLLMALDILITIRTIRL